MELTPEELEAERRAYMERQGMDWGEPAVDPGPTGRVLGRKLAEAAAPYVQKVREEHFGSPDPPWESREEDSAVEWEAARFKRTMLGNQTEDDRAFDRAVEELTDATGFKESDVYEWLLCGTTPTLSRATLRVEDQKKELDGTVIRRRSATLTLNAPISEKELRRAYRERIRPLWEADSATDVIRHRGKRITDLDYHLDQLVERTPDATWKERLKEWREIAPDWWTGTATEWREEHGDVSATALRVRWHRLEEKKQSLASTEEQTDGDA